MQPRPEINLTPLIDISFVILIILMVAIPVEIGRIELDLPHPDPPEAPPIPADEAQLVVALYRDGTLALNRQALSEPELRDALGKQLAPREKKLVFVDADGSVSLGQLVDAVDTAREAGATRIGLPRIKASGPREPLPLDDRGGESNAIGGSVPTTEAHRGPQRIYDDDEGGSPWTGR